jgi:hypothetical protein
MTQTKFRSLPLREAPNRVDRDERVIYGVSAAQAVEALGHGMMLDSKTLEQIVTLGNATKNGVGIKSRYTHPGLSSDGMGKQLGRMKNFRVEGDKAVGDMHLYASAFKSPDGNLGEYVMDLAEEDSAAFGMSIVFEAEKVWTLDDGTETPAESFYGDDEWKKEKRPDNALTEIPVVRVKALDAVDVVDEPAANRDGMFSASLWGTNVVAEQMFGQIDEWLQRTGFTPEKAVEFALKYGDARGVKPKGIVMQEQDNVVETQDEEIVVAVEIENEGDEEVTQEEMQALQAQLNAEKAERESATALAKQLQAKVEAMELAARTARFSELAKSWQGEPARHMVVLEALGEGSEEYGVYVAHMNALSEQIQAGNLFAEVGKNPKVATGSANDKLSAEARKIQAAENVTWAKAMELAAQRNPALYAEHVEEMRGN